ncbi:MAG: thiamine-phosphate kinase [Flavobacteriales bacterium]|nr:thiamine-phosphate kinase [Flavobacteriales bacterium]
MSDQRTELSQLGEFRLIQRLTEQFELKNPQSVLGVGDDAALLDAAGKQVVVSTDLLTEGVHFDLSYVPLKHLGYKSVIANLSDIAAMNALPAQILVSIGVSNRFSIEALDELYAGMKKACDVYGVDLVGGDTTSSASGLIISITVVGYADAGEVVRRNTAAEKDLIVVTGDLGAAYMGLQILEREKAVYQDSPSIQPDLSGNDYILQRQLLPEARVDVVKSLKELGVRPSSMIDISDGLSSELLHLATGSNVGLVLYEEKIPIDHTTFQAARDFDLDPTTCALNGGEDYELLFTIAQDDYDNIRNHPDFTVIGYTTDAASGYQLIAKNGHVSQLTAQGWQHLNVGD